MARFAKSRYELPGLEIVLANLARQTPGEVLATFIGGVAAIDAAGELWHEFTLGQLSQSTSERLSRLIPRLIV